MMLVENLTRPQVMPIAPRAPLGRASLVDWERVRLKTASKTRNTSRIYLRVLALMGEMFLEKLFHWFAVSLDQIVMVLTVLQCEMV